LSGHVTSTLRISGAIFDRWREYDNLRQDLNDCCAILSLRSGYNFEVAEAQLKAAHTTWTQQVELWLVNLLPESTKELSHLKKAALLLANLIEFGCIIVSGPTKPLRKRRDNRDQDLLPPLSALSERDTRKLTDGGCHYIAWILIYHVCEFFERRRPDRTDKYVSRITEDFELDMVSGLLSAKVSAQSIHLILKALFVRD
jgi:hypothetical protein